MGRWVGVGVYLVGFGGERLDWVVGFDIGV